MATATNEACIYRVNRWKLLSDWEGITLLIAEELISLCGVFLVG